MKTKRYFAATMQQALRQVREDIGADAVILQSRKTDEGVEIIAAADYDESHLRERFEPAVKKSAPEVEMVPASKLAELQAEHHRKMEVALEASRQRINDIRGKAGVQPGVRGTSPAKPAAAPAAASSDALSQMRAEIGQLRELLQAQVQPTPSRETSLVQQRLEEKLLDFGLEPALAREQAAAGARAGNLDEGWRLVMRWLATSVKIPEQDVVQGGGIYALVGPTGAGKTSTIGKLAARYVLAHGAESVALVTTDRYRIAAHEQLFVFGRILNIPVRVVDEHHNLDQVLDDLAGKRLILIDTAGLTPADRGFQQQLNELRGSRHKIRNLMVTASTSQPQIMRANWQAYKTLTLVGAVITKVDEAMTLGEMFSFIVRSGLPVVYWTNGQKIPDDVHKATLAGLLKYAMRGAAPEGDGVARHEKRA